MKLSYVIIILATLLSHKIYLIHVFQNHYLLNMNTVNTDDIFIYNYTACTILSLLMRCVVFVTRVISEFRLCDHSFNTSLGSLVCWKLTMPAGRSILAYIVLLVTSRDTKSSMSFKINKFKMQSAVTHKMFTCSGKLSNSESLLVLILV